MSEGDRHSDAPPPPPEIVGEVFPPEAPSPTITYDIAPAAIVKIVGAFFAVKLLFAIWPVFIIVGFALMLTAAFNPLVRRLQSVLTRTWAVVAIVVLALTALIGGLLLLVPPVYNDSVTLMQKAPDYTHQLQNLLASHHMRLNVEQYVRQFSTAYTNQASKILEVVSGVVEGAAGVLAVLVLATYLLIEGPRAGAGLSRLLPKSRRRGARNMVAEIGTQVGGYIRGQIISSVLAGIFATLVLWFNKVPDALALGALAAIADVIPIIGILIATGAAVLIALTVSPGTAGIVLVLYLVYHQLESHIIIPQIYGNTLGLSLSVIAISILVGVQLMGIVGAALALPVAAAIPSIVRYAQEWQDEQPGDKDPGRLP